MIDHLQEYVKRVAEHLRGLGVHFAVVGGIAVSLRTVERFTKDVDFALSVKGDEDAEEIVESLRNAGFRIAMFLEREQDGRLMTVRLKSVADVEVFVDLLFATSGIEPEVVADATVLEIFPDLHLKLATVPALMAMKLLSADWATRPQDTLDIQQLLRIASPSEIKETRHLLDLITERGFSRGKDLHLDFDTYIERFSS